MKKNILSSALSLSLLSVAACQSESPNLSNTPTGTKIASSSTDGSILTNNPLKKSDNTEPGVSQATPSSLLISQSSIKLAISEQRKLDAAVQLSDGSFSKEVTWLSSDSAVVLISPQGEVKRIAKGDTSVVVISLKNPYLRKQIEIIDPESDLIPFARQTPIPVNNQSPVNIIPSTMPSAVKPPSDISIIENTTINGNLFDDDGNPIDAAKVIIKSLTAALEFKAETVTLGGTYVFNNVPAGAQVEIVASKDGFTTRRRVEVPKSNKEGNPNANKYDFGSAGTQTTAASNYALSDKPEVIRVSPDKNSSNVALSTGITLTFNEPVIRQSVEETIAIRSFINRKLSVDDSLQSSTLTGSSLITQIPDDGRVFDQNDFNFSWNSTDTEVNLRFKNELHWPSDHDSTRLPEYQIAFKSFGSQQRAVRDKQGNSRTQKHFKFAQGPFEESVSFAVAADQIAPQITSMSLESSERAGLNGDAITLSFSERMAILLRDGRLITGGMGDTQTGIQRAVASFANAPEHVTPQAVAQNYTVRVQNPGGVLRYQGTLDKLGASVIFYANNDPTYKTILITLPSSSGQRIITGTPLLTENIELEHLYSDGQTQKISINPTSLSYEQIESALNTSLTNGSFRLKELDNPAGNAGMIDAKDTYSLTLSADAQGPTGKNIVSSRILSTSLFASDKMNAPANGYLTVSGSEIDARFDLFKPGDSVQLNITSSVLDPAGNSLDTNKNTVSALVP